MRLVIAGFALALLVACAGTKDSAHVLQFQMTGDEPQRSVHADPVDSGGVDAPANTEAEAVHRVEDAIAAAERIQRSEALSEEEREVLSRSLVSAVPRSSDTVQRVFARGLAPRVSE